VQAGAALWTVSFTAAGFFFGALPFVQKNFTLVVLAIILISVLPVAYEVRVSQSACMRVGDALTDSPRLATTHDAQLWEARRHTSSA
jgi:membrane-associated protein